MTTLGSWPSERYPVSWVTQRLANRAPEYTHVRKWPFSVFQQIANSTAVDIQRVVQQLSEERNNIFLSSCNMFLLNKLNFISLGVGMDFTKTENLDNDEIYTPPTVYAEIDDVEYTLTQAQYNSLESLGYLSLPSRIKDAEESYVHNEVVPRTTVANLSTVTPASMTTYGHLIATIRGNTTWYVDYNETRYYSKLFIEGKNRQGVEMTEVIPLSYNGSFKSIHQWQSVEEVYVNHVDSAAEITVDVFDFDQPSFIDVKNIIVNKNGNESYRFVRLGSQVWGSTYVSEGFTEPILSNIHLGFDAIDTEYEMELLDTSGNNVDLNAIAVNDNFNYVLGVDNNNLYVYNQDLPWPETQRLTAESTNTKMDLYSDRWVFARDATAVINTDTLDVTSIPYRFRWTLEDPSGNTWYVGKDGSKWPVSTDAWIYNVKWENGYWDEQRLELLLDEAGTYILTLECIYADVGETEALTTRHLLYVPSIRPEVEFSLPTALKNPTDISFDSDGNIWLLIDGDIHKLNLYYDYFIVDYEGKKVWFREDYSSVRVKV